MADGSPFRLPDAVWDCVLRHLKAHHRSSLRGTCSKFRTLVNASVTKIKVDPTHSEDALQWSLATRFPRLEHLEVMKPSEVDCFTDVLFAQLALKDLARLPALSSVNLENCTQLTVAGMAALALACSSISRLVIPQVCQLCMSDAMLLVLARLPQLTKLRVQCCKHCDEVALAYLSDLRRLTALELEDYGQALRQLTQLTSLTSLRSVMVWSDYGVDVADHINALGGGGGGGGGGGALGGGWHGHGHGHGPGGGGHHNGHGGGGGGGGHWWHGHGAHGMQPGHPGAGGHPGALNGGGPHGGFADGEAHHPHPNNQQQQQQQPALAGLNPIAAAAEVAAAAVANLNLHHNHNHQQAGGGGGGGGGGDGEQDADGEGGGGGGGGGLGGVAAAVFQNLDAAFVHQLQLTEQVLSNIFAGKAALLDWVTSMMGLTHVDIQRVDVTAADLARFAALPGLLHLGVGDLSLEPPPDSTVALPRPLSSVTKLVSHNIMHPSALRTSFPALRALSCDAEDRGLTHVGELTGLVNLFLWTNPPDSITDAGLGALSGLRGLETFRLEGSDAVTNDGWRRFTETHCALTRVDLVKCPGVTDIGFILSIRQLPRLQRISFIECPAIDTPSLAALLAFCSDLEHIELQDCSAITLASLRALLASVNRPDLDAVYRKGGATRVLHGASR